jgi:hypothetical protein
VRRLVFVDRAADAAPPTPGVTTVVLDGAWTPSAEMAHPPIPIRPVVRSIVEEVDVIDGSLAALDEWAAAAGLPEAFSIDGVPWWFRVRMLLRWDAHELLLWSLVLDRLGWGRAFDAVAIPSGRHQLVAAARTAAPETLRSGADAGTGSSAIELVRPRPPAQRFIRRNRRRLQQMLDRFRPPAGALPDRLAILEGRLQTLSREPGGVLALAWPRAFQVLRDGGLERWTDPYLVGALDRLAADGEPVTTIGLGLDPGDDGDWPVIEGDPRLLPDGFLDQRLGGPEGDESSPPALAAALERSAGMPQPTYGVDLGPGLAQLVGAYGGRWLARQRRAFRAAQETISALGPAVLFTNREASRTAWLAAARRAGVPSVAIQHGMLYPNSPEYFHSAQPGRVRPDVTCVFGDWERDLLVAEAGFRPDEVRVTGSPRPLAPATSEDPGERDRVRRELDVGPGDHVLVVSVAHNEVLGELHTFATLERLLGGPLPGIHLVIKLHPQDSSEPRHATFFDGLAAAGGYPPPRLSIVRDVDLYRLLRAADAHLGQFSTVLSDAVVAGTPNMIAVGQAYADALGYVAAGVATPVRSIDEVRAFMRYPRSASPEARGRFLEAHYRPGDSVGRLAGVLRETMQGATVASPAAASTGADARGSTQVRSGSAG